MGVVLRKSPVSLEDENNALQRQLAYFNRGLARELQGDRAGAIEDYDRVLVLKPASAKARARLRHLKTGGR